MKQQGEALTVYAYIYTYIIASFLSCRWFQCTIQVKKNNSSADVFWGPSNGGGQAGAANDCVSFGTERHHIDLEQGAVYTFIDLHRTSNDELKGEWITSLRGGPCWFYSMLLWMLNKWTSSAIVDARFVPLFKETAGQVTQQWYMSRLMDFIRQER